ncbi:MAG: hypothetical protein ABF969_04025 [Sporolactobacillus sp.]
MGQPVSIQEFLTQHPAMLPNRSEVKQLISNLAAEANEILITNGFTDEVREILQSIQMLKH